MEGGWEEGGEKGGRDEGWREEEEVRRGWREGVERGSIGGCGRSIEFSEREEWRREECWIERLSIALSFEWARGWRGRWDLAAASRELELGLELPGSLARAWR